MRAIIFILVILFFTACSQKNNIPKGILSQQEMRTVLWDLMRSDEFVNGFLSKDSLLNRKKASIILYEKVFRLHKTNQEEFNKSLSFYQSRPDLLKVIADSLHVDEKKALENQYNHEKPVADTGKMIPSLKKMPAN